MSNDVLRMQQEAEARVRRMREQSRMLVGGDVPESGRSQAGMAAGRPPLYRRSPPVPETPACPSPEPPPCETLAAGSETKPARPGGMFQDQEQLFLLLLAMLLIKNGAQIEIIIALLYLAM